MAWCFTDEASEFTEALLHHLSNLTDSAIVPALWLYEVVNVTELSVRRGRITAKRRTFFWKVWRTCPSKLKIRLTAGICCRSRAGRSVSTHKPTTPSYLELAIRHGFADRNVR
jgi:predicted nucleic acid-binding protein